MKTPLTFPVVLLASAGILVAGCEHPDERNVATASPAPASAPEPVSHPTMSPAPSPAPAQAPRAMGATNVQPGSVATVIERLATARCNREQTCDNVGNGKKYASRQVCMEQLRGGIANDLNPYQCPGGIDGAAVDACISAVGAEECGAHPIEAITRIDKCRNGAMCRK